MHIFQRHAWPGNARELEHVIEGILNLVGAMESSLELRHLQLHQPTWYRLKQQAFSDRKPLPGAGLEGAARGEVKSLWAVPGLQPAECPGEAEAGLSACQAGAEKRAIHLALEAHQGNITSAARSLGISRQLCAYKMKKHGIDRRDHRP
jgi:arginine utilization regulatory protein